MRPPFAVTSNQSRSPTVSAQRVINAYPEIQPEDAKSLRPWRELVSVMVLAMALGWMAVAA